MVSAKQERAFKDRYQCEIIEKLHIYYKKVIINEKEVSEIYRRFGKIRTTSPTYTDALSTKIGNLFLSLISPLL